MLIDFKKTECYTRIKNSNQDITTPVPYYVKTDMIVTEDNFSALVDLEEIKYKMKLDSIEEFPKFNIREKVEERIKAFMNDNLLELKYAYFNSNNVDTGYLDVEKTEFFSYWLVK